MHFQSTFVITQPLSRCELTRELYRVKGEQIEALQEDCQEDFR